MSLIEGSHSCGWKDSISYNHPGKRTVGPRRKIVGSISYLLLKGWTVGSRSDSRVSFDEGLTRDRRTHSAALDRVSGPEKVAGSLPQMTVRSRAVDPPQRLLRHKPADETVALM
ncbi:hypothetical protein J6590_013236 [Homalodisca vitripennis]|nr:hypothetical protein J6590_013236 [Homalodisca vitripennis]